jgi:hypothetical protein
MSKVPPNPEQPGRILEEHLHDGLVIDGELDLPAFVESVFGFTLPALRTDAG